MALTQTEPKSIKIWTTEIKKVYIWTTKVRPTEEYWTIANATLNKTCNLSQSNYYDECLEFSPDWLHFYTSNNATSNWPYQVNLGTAWDVSSAIWQTDMHSEMYYGSRWNWNGTPHFNTDWTVCWNVYWQQVRKWTLLWAWNPSWQKSYIAYTSSNYEIFSRWRKFINDWKKVWTINNKSGISSCCNVYDLTTPYDLTTINMNSLKYNTNITWWDADGFYSPQWYHLYYVSPDLSTVKHYKMTIPRDVSTATLVEEFSQSGVSWIFFHWNQMYLKYRAGNVKQFTVVHN